MAANIDKISNAKMVMPTLYCGTRKADTYFESRCTINVADYKKVEINGIATSYKTYTSSFTVAGVKICTHGNTDNSNTPFTTTINTVIDISDKSTIDIVICGDDGWAGQYVSLSGISFY